MFAGLLVLTYGLFQSVPGGFVPSQDKQYLIGFAQLPDGATLDRTDRVIERMGAIMANNENVEGTLAFTGLSINGFTNSPNAGVVFAMLKPFEQRTGADQSGMAVAAQLNQAFAGIEEAVVVMFHRPPCRGLAPRGASSCSLRIAAGSGMGRWMRRCKVSWPRRPRPPS